MQIDVNLTRTAADLITEFSADAKVYLYSSATEAGSYSLVTLQTAGAATLVDGTERYELIDASGTPGTTWYKFRVGNSAGSAFTDYSSVWLSGSLTAYATLDDLREVVGEGDAVTYNNLFVDLLIDVSADIDALTGRSFLRQPQVSGTQTTFFTVTRAGMRSLSLATVGAGRTDGRALDIISVTSLWYRTSETAAYVQLTEGTDFYLKAGAGPGVAGTDWPFEDVVLITGGALGSWSTGYAPVKEIGADGFPKVPATVKRATIAEVHERWRQEVGGGPSQLGVTAQGVPMFLTGDTLAMRKLAREPFAKRSYAAT